MNLEIKTATQDDLPEILEILDELSAWGLSSGKKIEWPLPWPSDYIAEIVETGEMYLAYRADQSANPFDSQSQAVPVATFALRSSDEEAWGHQPPDAFYVHHLGVRRSQNRKGVGGQLLEWSATHALASGKSFLRLDCIASNPFLQEYYIKAGFTHVACHFLPHDRGRICLFEKTLAWQPGV